MVEGGGYLLSGLDGGYLPSQVWVEGGYLPSGWGGVPTLRFVWGEVPTQVWMGGTYLLGGGGYLLRSGWGGTYLGRYLPTR